MDPVTLGMAKADATRRFLAKDAPQSPVINDDAVDRVWRVVDQDGNEAIGLDESGSVWVGRFGNVPAATAVQAPDEDSLYFLRLRDQAGNIAVGLTIRGELDARRFTPELLSYLRGEVGGSTSTTGTAAASAAWMPEVISDALYATYIPTGQRIQIDTATVSDVRVLGQDIVWTKGGVQYHRHLPGETNFRAISNKAKLSIWGSSTAAGLAPYLDTMSSTDLGVTSWWTGGVGGNQMEQIAARLGSVPATVDAFTIPASGSVAVVVQNVSGASVGTVSYVGHFAGFDAIPGTLSISSGTFTRTTGGSTQAIPAGTAFIPDKGVEFRDGVAILNWGKNSLTALTSAQEVLNSTIAAYDYLRSVSKHVLVVNHFCDTNMTVDGAYYTNVRAYNTALAEHFGDRVVDLYSYVASAQVWTDTGITPNSTDLAQQSNGLKPTSLSDDDLHLNAAGYGAVTTYLIKPALQAKGWYS